jgi:hypothetical protein
MPQVLDSLYYRLFRNILHGVFTHLMDNAAQPVLGHLVAARFNIGKTKEKSSLV